MIGIFYRYINLYNWFIFLFFNCIYFACPLGHNQLEYSVFLCSMSCMCLRNHDTKLQRHFDGSCLVGTINVVELICLPSGRFYSHQKVPGQAILLPSIFSDIIFFEFCQVHFLRRMFGWLKWRGMYFIFFLLIFVSNIFHFQKKIYGTLSQILNLRFSLTSTEINRFWSFDGFIECVVPDSQIIDHSLNLEMIGI